MITEGSVCPSGTLYVGTQVPFCTVFFTLKLKFSARGVKRRQPVRVQSDLLESPAFLPDQACRRARLCVREP
jgi:hypothetical protein